MNERDSGSNSDNQPKLPFSETRRIYREGVENLIRSMLDDPESELSRRLGAGDAAFVDAGNERGRGGRRRLIPIALPIDYKLERGNPENAHNMTQLYLNGVGKFDQTLQEVGNYYSVTRQAVQQAITTATHDAFKNSQTQPYGFEDLTFDNPSSHIDERVLVLTDPEVDRAVKRELIKVITVGVKQYYSKDRQNISAVFVDVSEVAREAGFYQRLRKGDSSFLAEYLDSRSIPVGEVQQVIENGKQKGSVNNYRFILVADREEAIDILKGAEGERFEQMRKNPVRSYGPKFLNLPNTTQLRDREDYPSIFKLLSVYGITNPKQLVQKNMDLSHLMHEPPVTVYQVGLGWSVAKEDADELQNYLGQELKRWGVIE